VQCSLVVYLPYQVGDFYRQMFSFILSFIRFLLVYPIRPWKRKPNPSQVFFFTLVTYDGKSFFFSLCFYYLATSVKTVNVFLRPSVLYGIATDWSTDGCLYRCLMYSRLLRVLPLQGFPVNGKSPGTGQYSDIFIEEYGFFGHLYFFGCLLTLLYAGTYFTLKPSLHFLALFVCSFWFYFLLCFVIRNSFKSCTISKKLFFCFFASGSFTTLFSYFFLKTWSSETTRKDLSLRTALLNIEPLASFDNSFEPSVHRPSHFYPCTLCDWGWYLAGLIDADGSFSSFDPVSQPKLTICFHLKDIHLAYKIRTLISYGTVSKIKNKNSCIYVLTNHNGFLFLLPLLFNKLQHQQKRLRYQSLCHFFNLSFPSPFLPIVPSSVDSSSLFPFPLLHNYWLAGFIDGDGSLQIKLLTRRFSKFDLSFPKIKYEVRLQLQIELCQDCFYLLAPIKNVLGGNLYFRKSISSYYYNTTSFLVFKKLVHYLDRYPLCSNKYKEYVIWRRAYFYRKDFSKIKKMKSSLSVLKR
jgi:hypothetical protein